MRSKCFSNSSVTGFSVSRRMTAIGARFPFSGCQDPISPEKMPAICSSERVASGLVLCTMRLTPSRAIGKPKRSFSSAFSARAIMPISAFPSLTSLMPRSDPPHCTSIRTSGRTARNRSPIAAISGHIVLEPVIRSSTAGGLPARPAASSARASRTPAHRRRNPVDDQTRPRLSPRNRIGVPRFFEVVAELWNC